MRKLSVLIVMLMFLLSIVAVASAENGAVGTNVALGGGVTVSSDVNETNMNETEETADSVNETTEEGETTESASETEEETDETETEEEQDVDVNKTDDSSQGKAYGQEIQKCVRYMTSNRVRVPMRVCERLVKRGELCKEALTNEGVAADEADAICNRYAVQTGQMIAATAAKAAEWKERKMDELRKKSSKAKETLNSLPEETMNLFASLPASEQNKLIRMEKEMVKEKLQNMRIVKVKKEMLFKQRQIAKDKLEKAKERFDAAKEKFKQATEKYQEIKQQFQEAKEKISGCSENETDGCRKLNEDLIVKSKEHLANTIDRLTSYLEKLKEKINSAENVLEDEAAAAVAKIDAGLTNLNELKTKLESAQTKDEIVSIAKEVRTVWNRIKNRAKLYSSKLIYNHVGEIIQRSQNLENRLSCLLEKMNEQGIEVSELDTTMTAFSSALEQAKAKYDEATTLLKTAKETDGNFGNVSQQANELLKEAQAKLKEAHDLLKDIVSDIKDKGGDINSCNEEAEVTAENETIAEDEAYQIVDTTETVPFETTT
ncbi:hypothetical protein JXA85_08655 [Candidatus Woesearchaeota archaeon]|nr:hypothetical protein [Candidatus Woesearchaeota archaeon]